MEDKCGKPGEWKIREETIVKANESRGLLSVVVNCE